MADNTTLETPSSAGDILVTREVSHGGDTAKMPGSFIVGISGSEGSYTYAAIDGSAANGLEVDVTRVTGTVTVDGSGVTQPVSAASLPLPSGAATAANQSTGNTALAAIQTAVEGTLTVGSHAVTNAGTFAVQVDGDALTALQLIDDAVADEGAALGKGVLLQGDDGTDRKNINVDATTGDVQVDVTNTVTVNATTSGDVPVTLDGEAVSISGTVTVDASGTAVPVTDNNGSLTVDNGGTFAVQAAQSGTWNITNVSGTVSLPTGAATAAKQPALGTAGTASSDVITVQGITSMTPLVVDLGSNNDVTLATLPDTAAGDLAAINAAVSGTLTVGSHAVTNAGTFAVQVDGTALTRLTDIETNTDFGATTGGGTESGALRVTIANNSTGVLSVDDNGSSLTVDGTVTAELSATDNAVLDAIAASVAERATSHYRNIDANAEAAIKASAGTLYWIHAINMTAAVAYLHLYDETTGNVNPGTTTPTYTFPIPTQGSTDGSGFVINLGTRGQAFANAITLVVTTTIDGSAGDPGTNGVFINAGYA